MNPHRPSPSRRLDSVVAIKHLTKADMIEKTPLTVTKDLTKRELTLERVLHAPRDLVWEGWTRPEHISRWWGPRGWTTTFYEMDVRPGGVCHYCMRSDSGSAPEVWGRAVYRVVDEPALLVYTEGHSDSSGADLDDEPRTTSIAFVDQGENTGLILRTQFPSLAKLERMLHMGMVEGLTMSLDRLAEQLDGR